MEKQSNKKFFLKTRHCVKNGTHRKCATCTENAWVHGHHVNVKYYECDSLAVNVENV